MVYSIFFPQTAIDEVEKKKREGTITTRTSRYLWTSKTHHRGGVAMGVMSGKILLPKKRGICHKQGKVRR